MTSQPPTIHWTNTVVWTCETCGNQFTEAFCGRLRHMCLECGTLFVENAPPVWYSPIQQKEMGYHTICETVYGVLVRCTDTGIRPEFGDVQDMGRLYVRHETIVNGSEPTHLSRQARPRLR